MSERAQQSHVCQEKDTQQSSSQVASKVQPLEIVENNNNNVDTTQTPIQTAPINSDELQVQTTAAAAAAAATTTTLTPILNQPASVNPVRVLFQDRHHQQSQLYPQQQQGQQLLSGQQTNSGAFSYGGGDITARPDEQHSQSDTEALPPLPLPHPPLLPPIRTPVLTAPVINLNRQLIERQLEAMQAADSQRWNFDFRQNRPLRIEGHRYQVVQCLRPDCSTMNEQSTNNPQTNTGTRFNQQQRRQQQQQQRQCRGLSAGQGSDCNQTHRDKPDHRQDDSKQ